MPWYYKSLPDEFIVFNGSGDVSTMSTGITSEDVDMVIGTVLR